MDLGWAEEAEALGKVVESAVQAAGGVALARQAAADPTVRATAVAPVLDDLGLWDIDVDAGGAELEAAALACRSAGRFGLPYPVAERLARPRRHGVDAVVVVDPEHPRGAMVDLDLRWVAVDAAGRSAAVAGATPLATRMSGHVCTLVLGPWSEPSADARRTLAVLLTLSAWTLVGALEGAIDLTREHVTTREQFGKPLSANQAVQFQLADAYVAVQGLRELAKYTVWSLEVDRPEALVDAVALRTCAQESAEAVFRTCHQLHGATGFCDETPVSWLSRAGEPLRYLPMAHDATERWLTELVEAEGFTGLFGAGA